jgi:hypothetical protein
LLCKNNNGRGRQASCPFFDYVNALNRDVKSAEPPYLLIKNNADKVDDPYERSKEEKNNRNNDSNGILCFKTSQKTVNSPNNVKCGDAENELNYPRKIVKQFDSFFHGKPPKNKFCFQLYTLYDIY